MDFFFEKKYITVWKLPASNSVNAWLVWQNGNQMTRIGMLKWLWWPLTLMVLTLKKRTFVIVMFVFCLVCLFWICNFSIATEWNWKKWKLRKYKWWNIIILLKNNMVSLQRLELDCAIGFEATRNKWCLWCGCITMEQPQTCKHRHALASIRRKVLLGFLYFLDE